jgi:1-acyl-sn-glycerol-3-phosphate acyltransferase
VQSVRSLVFNIASYLSLFVLILFFMPLLLMPRRYIWVAVRSWSGTTNWLLRVLCGIRYEVRGLEYRPAGGILVASKHQSAWETFTLAAMLDDPTFVLKRELQWIPLFGWYTMKARLIPVDRGGRAVALASMAKGAKERIAERRQIVIYPEGTRRAPGAEPQYKFGVAHLYGELDVPCVPVALNSGLYWPRRSLALQPGTIVMEFLPPIPPGLDKAEFLQLLEQRIEAATARLVAEGRAEIARTKN